MATIRERHKKDGSRAFSVQVRMTGFPARTATFRNRREAERWAKTVEAEMIEGKHFRSAEARRRTLGETIDRYLEEQVPKKRDGRMHRAYLPWWKETLGHLKLADITPALVAECRDKLAKGSYQRAKPESNRSTVKGAARQYSRSPSTVNKYLACLSHVFTIARKEWHYVSYNPMDGVAKLKEGPGRIRTLSDDERKALLAETAKDPKLHTFVMIALSTACRAGELRHLAWNDVDLKTGRLLFRQTKNAQPRTAWVHGTALSLLQDHAKVRKLQGGAVFENPTGRGLYDYYKPFKAAVEAAGLDNFRFHDLRHTAATYLAQQGASEQQLRAIGGWKSGIVSKYVHLAAEDAKTALEELSARLDK